MVTHITQSLREQVELDTLFLLDYFGEPLRFSQILEQLQELEKGKQNKYEKPNVVKTLLAKSLNNLEKDGIIKKYTKTRKNCQYSIRSEKKTKTRLISRLDESEQGIKKNIELYDIYKTPIDELANDFVETTTNHLLIYEAQMIEAKRKKDFSTFKILKEAGASELSIIWLSFVEYLEKINDEDKNAACEDGVLNKFYSEKFKTPTIQISENVSNKKYATRILKRRHEDLQLLKYKREIYQKELSKINDYIAWEQERNDEEYVNDNLKVYSEMSKKLNQP